MNEKFLENEENQCTECGEFIKKGKSVWLELAQDTGDYYFNGIPKGKNLISQGWHPFGSRCAKNKRVD